MIRKNSRDQMEKLVDSSLTGGEIDADLNQIYELGDYQIVILIPQFRYA